MIAPPLPSNEEERLSLLAALSILDTTPEPVFDRVTRLASRILNVPVALFSLVDQERQWFKSRVGLDVAETPREHSFCGHAILRSEPMIIPDALADERFHDNPLVTGEPHIRFYAGIPIRTSTGLAIGSLCVIDTQPRELSAAELGMLTDLADIITQEIQNRERLVAASRHVQRSDEVLRAGEATFRTIFELANMGIALVAPNGSWINVNSALCSMLGYSAEELYGLTFQDLTHPDDLEEDLIHLRRLRDGALDRYQVEKRYVRKDKTLLWTSLNVTRKLNAAGELEYFISVIKDIHDQILAENALSDLYAVLESRVEARTRELYTLNETLTASIDRQRQAEEELRTRESELRSVIENANDAYIGLDQNGIVTRWNRQAEETFGWTAAEAIGKSLEQLIIPEHMASAHQNGMARYVATGKPTFIDKRLELPAVRKDGSPLTVEVRIRALEVNDQKMFSAFLHDITDRKRAEAQREYESRHDPLTGLLNRRALMEMLPIAQARVTRHRESLGLLFIDLDGFKAVNDTHGHDAGDQLLCVIAERLRAAVRKTDSVFRLAGDEFTVLLGEVSDTASDPHLVAQKLIAIIAEPVAIGDAHAVVGASIGIAAFNAASTQTAAELIKEADQWMYKAKQAGRGQICPQREDRQPAR